MKKRPVKRCAAENRHYGSELRTGISTACAEEAANGRAQGRLQPFIETFGCGLPSLNAVSGPGLDDHYNRVDPPSLELVLALSEMPRRRLTSHTAFPCAVQRSLSDFRTAERGGRLVFEG